MTPSLAQRSVSSAAWNVGTSIFRVVLGFIHTTALARLLPVETFGIYASAVAVVGLTGIFSRFGLESAFLHRAPENESLEDTAAQHMLLLLVFTAIWAALLLGAVLLFTDADHQELRTAFIVVTLAQVVINLAETPRLMLVRQVQHRRIATIRMTDIALTTVTTIILALAGAGLWALLFSNVVSAVTVVVGLYLWRPVWRVRLSWNRPRARYFLRFGSQGLIAQLLSAALDRVDDIWTGAFLGTEALGLYSRAYLYAVLPQSLLAQPVNLVAAGAYAELKTDRANLSLAFQRINSLMIRSGFLFGGGLALLAPEFILILLGDKWLPMVDPFRLMLIFTLFDPLKHTTSGLFTAVGQQGILVRYYLIQLGVLALGLFGLGLPLGINGVALAVNLMLLTGIGLNLRRARDYVDYSLRALFLGPAAAVALGLAGGFALEQWPAAAASVWLSAILKGLVFTGIYGGVLLIADREQLRDMTQIIRRYLLRRQRPTPPG
jgi:PST family polysaccharide transporter